MRTALLALMPFLICATWDRTCQTGVKGDE